MWRQAASPASDVRNNPFILLKLSAVRGWRQIGSEIALRKSNDLGEEINMTEQGWQAGFLDKFSPPIREKLLSLAEGFRFKAGKDIISEGDFSDYVYILKSGRVAVEINMPPKGRRTIRTGEAGDMISWSALVQPHRATASLRAVQDTEALGIKGELLIVEAHKDCQLGFELYRALTEVIAGRLSATRLQFVNVYAIG
jgi:CRP/FNR family cyclic AMP-dependent transcriptional regulator